jgi:hypothetical protein
VFIYRKTKINFPKERRCKETRPFVFWHGARINEPKMQGFGGGRPSGEEWRSKETTKVRLGEGSGITVIYRRTFNIERQA